MFDQPQQRLDGFTRLLAASVLACLAFSWKLWLSRTYYPLVPVASWIPSIPPPYDGALLGAFVALLLVVIIWPRSRGLLAAVIAVWGFLLLQDQSRWWPSFYQFFVLWLLIASARNRTEETEATRVIARLQFVFAAVYFWSGVQKLNVHFFYEEFPWFLEPILTRLPVDLPAWPWLGMAAALFEMAIGVGLLTRRFRRVALYDAMLMHLVILFCIGPLRDHWNNSAWIWNLTVAIQAWLLFHRSPAQGLGAMFAASWKHNIVPVAVVLLIGIAPVANNFNRWDSALSFNVYSGNVDYAEVHLSLDAARALPESLQPFVELGLGRGILYLHQWTQAEFNSNPYPEARVFLAVFRRLCGMLERGTATLYIQEKSGWWIPHKIRRYDCQGDDTNVAEVARLW